MDKFLNHKEIRKIKVSFIRIATSNERSIITFLSEDIILRTNYTNNVSLQLDKCDAVGCFRLIHRSINHSYTNVFFFLPKL